MGNQHVKIATKVFEDDGDAQFKADSDSISEEVEVVKIGKMTELVWFYFSKSC